MYNDFKLNNVLNEITINKNGNNIMIKRLENGDISFTSYGDTNIVINGFSNNQEECMTYSVFENLLKNLVGDYYLNRDEMYFPKNFFNLDTKTFTFHSEDAYLKLRFEGSKINLSVKDTVLIEKDRIQFYNIYSDFNKFNNDMLFLFSYLGKLKNKNNNISKNNKILSLFKNKNFN